MATIDTPTLSVHGQGALPRVPFLRIKETVLGKRYALSIAFVSPAAAKEINIQYRGKDYVPNTLAFPLNKTTGEIIMCRSVIRSQHKNFDMDADTYLIFLLIHSMLHLKGYAHGGTMEREEKRYLKLFSNTHGKTTHNGRD
jgi:rRNA maturation RNase YbeY